MTAAQVLGTGSALPILEPLLERARLASRKPDQHEMHPTPQSPAPRKRRHLQVSFGPDGPFHKGLTLDLSKTGMFVVTFVRFEPGQKLRLLLDTPMGGLFIEGRVVWVCDNQHQARDDHRLGMGIQLLPASGPYDPYQDFLHTI